MKKMCFVTAARSEYGLLKWLMQEINASDEFQLQIIVTGGHLSYEQGHTIDQIVEDGFKITEVVDANLDVHSEVGIAETMGRMSEGFARAFERIKPDYLVVLGDRYELLPICSTAFVMRIPIIHISGGDVTEGAIDDGIRNAVTMLADYHFPGTEDSAKNIIRMRNSSKNVWIVGELGLDAFNRETLLNRIELADMLELDINKKWVLMTYHAETKNNLQYNLNNIHYCMKGLMRYENMQIVATYANADLGGDKINKLLLEYEEKFPLKIKVVPSLGQKRYLSFMKEVEFVIGNSSSGIVEAPFLHVPVINIGDRQKGRYQCGNILQCESEEEQIAIAIQQIMLRGKKEIKDWDYWGTGDACARMLELLKKI